MMQPQLLLLQSSQDELSHEATQTTYSASVKGKTKFVLVA